MKSHHYRSETRGRARFPEGLGGLEGCCRGLRLRGMTSVTSAIRRFRTMILFSQRYEIGTWSKTSVLRLAKEGWSDTISIGLRFHDTRLQRQRVCGTEHNKVCSWAKTKINWNRNSGLTCSRRNNKGCRIQNGGGGHSCSEHRIERCATVLKKRKVDGTHIRGVQ